MRDPHWREETVVTLQRAATEVAWAPRFEGLAGCAVGLGGCLGTLLLLPGLWLLGVVGVSAVSAVIAPSYAWTQSRPYILTMLVFGLPLAGSGLLGWLGAIGILRGQRRLGGWCLLGLSVAWSLLAFWISQMLSAPYFLERPMPPPTPAEEARLTWEVWWRSGWVYWLIGSSPSLLLWGVGGWLLWCARTRVAN